MSYLTFFRLFERFGVESVISCKEYVGTKCGCVVIGNVYAIDQTDLSGFVDYVGRPGALEFWPGEFFSQAEAIE